MLEIEMALLKWRVEKPMADPKYLSKSLFAAKIGRTPSYITWLGKHDRLVFAPDGKSIDVQATEARILESADPNKAAVAERHQKARGHLEPQGAADSPPPGIAPGPLMPGELPSFQKAKAYREYYEGRISEAKYRKQQGELIERSAVEAGAFEAARTTRDLLLGLPKQIAPELASISDPWELERTLTEALRRVLSDAARMNAGSTIPHETPEVNETS
jgi:hypothetical protein